jgi:hypothetical protein
MLVQTSNGWVFKETPHQHALRIATLRALHKVQHLAATHGLCTCAECTAASDRLRKSIERQVAECPTPTRILP